MKCFPKEKITHYEEELTLNLRVENIIKYEESKTFMHSKRFRWYKE